MKKQTWKMHFYKGVPCTWEHEPYDEEKVKLENYWEGGKNELA